MRKDAPPTELAEALLRRSVCAVQVGAVLLDSYGVFAWGWNHAGTGDGQHAESHALSRANKKRCHGATVCVAAARKGHPITSRPCVDCERELLAAGVREMLWMTRGGLWVREPMLR